MLLVDQIGNNSVRWKQTCRSGIRICSVIRNQEMVRKIQESQVPPIAGMKFLPVKKQSRRGGKVITAGAKVGNVRDPLFFVDDEVFNYGEILRLGLLYEMRGRVAISPSVIHVNMDVAADPLLSRCRRNLKRSKGDDHMVIARQHRQVLLLELILKSLHDYDLDAAHGNHQVRVARRNKVMGLERPLTSHEAVIGLHPSIVRSIGTSVISRDRDSCRSLLSGFVEHGNVQTGPRVYVAAFLRDNLPLSASQHFLYPQRSISASIRDKCDVLAIRSAARSYVVVLPKRQRNGI